MGESAKDWPTALALRPDPAACPLDAAPARLRITLLNAVTACDAAGQDRLPRVRKTRAILAILALAAPRPVTRSDMIALLWSRRDLPQARGSLRQALRELSMTLGPAATLLRIERAQIALEVQGLQVDLHQVAAAGPAQPDALALWHGTLLQDLTGLDPAFDLWIDAQREKLARRTRTAAEAILAAARGQAAITIAAERLLMIDPIHEPAWRALIQAHADRGDRAAAIRTFDHYSATLSARCQLVPAPDISDIVAGLRGTSAAPPIAQPRRRHGTHIRLGIAPLRGAAGGEAAEVAAALTEELIVALARFRWLGCVPCATGSADFDVDFLLTGVVQRSGDRVRVLLRLMNVRAGGEVVWAERFDRTVTDIFALQEQLAGTTAARIEPRLWLWQAEGDGAVAGTPRSAHDLLHVAIPALHRLDRQGFMAARQWFDRAVELDPDNATAHAWAAQWYLFCVGQGWAADPVLDVQRARDLAERAIQLDPDDARGLTLAGHVRGFLDHRPDEALRLHERAIAANPNLPLTWCLAGLAKSYAGDCTEATNWIRRAQELSPDDPLGYFHEMSLCVSYLLRGALPEAAEAGRRAIARNPGFSSAHKGYLAAIGHMGPDQDDGASRATLLNLEPGFSVAQAMTRSPITIASAREIYADGLRAAGLP